MYEVFISYTENGEDTLICESKPSASVKGGILFLDCGKGQKFAINISTLLYVKIKYPLPERVPEIKYAVDIHYHTETEDVELLFSPSTINVSVDGHNDMFTPVVYVKESDNIIRVINSTYLRNIKVKSYSEKSE